jgi:hypothetical protein
MIPGELSFKYRDLARGIAVGAGNIHVNRSTNLPE